MLGQPFYLEMFCDQSSSTFLKVERPDSLFIHHPKREAKSQVSLFTLAILPQLQAFEFVQPKTKQEVYSHETGR